MSGRQEKAVLLSVSWLQKQNLGTAVQLKDATTNAFEDNDVFFVTVSFKADDEYLVFDLSVDQDDRVTLIKKHE